jgi:hypothetical protein
MISKDSNSDAPLPVPMNHSTASLQQMNTVIFTKVFLAAITAGAKKG